MFSKYITFNCKLKDILSIFFMSWLDFFPYGYLARLKIGQVALVVHLNSTSDLSLEGSQGLLSIRNRYSS